MALTNHWFVQWNTPKILLTDIGNGYRDVNTNWDNNYNTLNNVYSGNGQYQRTLPYRKRLRQKYEYNANGSNENTQLAGYSLWLAMLGLAQPQPMRSYSDTPPFNTLFKWKQIDFEFLSEDHRHQMIASRDYIPENGLPLGLEVWGSRVWITLPKWRKGVPATLATVKRDGGEISPLLRPYPDWSYHEDNFKRKNCSGITSVFRMNIDNCGRLWVLDSGQIDTQDDPKQVCPPTIIVIDLKTDTIVARYDIPKKYVLENSLFTNIVVDSREYDCTNLHVYIADTWRFGLLVFREEDASFWRFSHHYFFPDPFASNFSLHGLNFQWTDGIFGLALSPIKKYEDRILFFHSMSGYREFYVKTSVLQDPFKINSSSTDFKIIGESRGIFGHSSASAMDNRGVMYYGLVTRDSVGCWDIQKPYLRHKTGVVAMNTETLVFPNDLKVDQESPQNIWVLSNRLPMFQSDSLDPNDYNYRIMYSNVEEAVRGTICDPNALPQVPSITHRG